MGRPDPEVDWVEALDRLGFGLVRVGPDARVAWVNRTAAQWIGLPLTEVIGTPWRYDTPGIEVLPAPGVQEGVHSHVRVRRTRPDGASDDFEARVILGSHGDLGANGMLAVVHEITPQVKNEERLRVDEDRLNALVALGRLAAQVDEETFRRLALEDAVRLTHSEIGYLHFVNDDQDTISLGLWSRNTLFKCSAVTQNHYPLSSAGIWADAARLRRPVVHNDYPHRTDRKGLPEGHFPLQRHVCVPVIEGDRVRALLGVGNKASDYGEGDVRHLQLVAQEVWRLLQLSRANARLEASRARLSRVFDNVPVGMALLDGDWLVVDANPVLASMLGISAAALVGRPLPEPVFAGARGCEHHRHAADDDAACEIPYVRPTGETLLLEVHAHRLDGEDGVAHVLAFRDITRRRQLERRLAEAQRLEGIGQLAAGIAHEINTPIQFVCDNFGFIANQVAPLLALLAEARASAPPDLAARIDALDLPFLQDDLPKAISDTHEGLRRVAQIVSAMKSFSHRGSGDRDPVDLRACIDTTLTVSRNEWKRVADAHNEVPADLPHPRADRGELNQVWLNLIVNAAQALRDRPVGAPPGRIVLSGRAVDGGVEISVADNGPGIPEAVRQRVFEPFFTTKPVGEGSGQGLAIAWHVVGEHLGRISFECPPTGGTLFRVWLPVSRDPG